MYRRVRWGFSVCGSHREGTLEAPCEGKSGSSLAASNPLGNAAEQFVGNGACGLGKLRNGGVITEDFDARSALHGQPCDIEHAAVHANRADNGAKLSGHKECKQNP